MIIIVIFVAINYCNIRLNVILYFHQLLIGWGFCPKDTPSDGIQHLVGTVEPTDGRNLWLATVVINKYAEFKPYHVATKCDLDVTIVELSAEIPFLAIISLNLRQFTFCVGDSHDALLLVWNNEGLHWRLLETLFTSPSHVLNCQPVTPGQLELTRRRGLSLKF